MPEAYQNEEEENEDDTSRKDQFRGALIIGGIVLFIILVVHFTSSTDSTPKQDTVTTLDTRGCIDSHIAVTHISDSLDLLTTTHMVWANGNTVKTINTYDTIPALGNDFTSAEDKSGNTEVVNAPREYEVYVTVK